MVSVWQFRGQSREHAFPLDVLEACEGSPLVARLLANRGVHTAEDIRAFLNLADYQPSSGWDLPDMEPAVKRILSAIERKEHILIYGDFDVDGITGTSILYETLKLRLQANVSYYIPDRATEGHGLNTAALVRLVSSRQVKLVITTDTGITNFSEVSFLNGLGVDTIVTDHHALPENLPPALANVNSQRLPESHPMQPLCGAGVAYKLSELLLEALLSPADAQLAADALLDIVALGTVVDMVPLIRENRYLVYRGLQVLNRRQRLGFNELLAAAGFKPDATITSETLGFTMGPRLNALGRLERADQGVELITGSDPDRARTITAHLEFLNRKRRDLCDQTFVEAETYLNRTGGLGDQRAIILGSPDWNPGIIGIVASRLIEKYHVPVFMMVSNPDKGEVRCSARSIPGFHLHDELLALEDYFLGFGGHAGAGGFALKQERLESFKRDLHAICARAITDEQMRPVIEVDARLDWSQINPHLIAMINRLAPFGMNNPAPKFVLENVAVSAQRPMGEGERHIKLILQPGKDDSRAKGASSTPLEGVIWNFNNRERFDMRAAYSFVFSPELNTFNGNTRVQLMIEDYQSLSSARQHTETLTPAETAPADSSAAAPESVVASVVGASPYPQWIDHRERDSLSSFISQLLMPLQERQRRALIYHEGRKPDIPFVQDALLATRLTVAPADELIFWDFPPSAEHWRHVMDRVQPQVIHLVGGKYQEQGVPVHPTAQNYLKLLLQMVRRPDESGSVVVVVEELASQLAMTSAVVTQGLMLLDKLGMVRVQLAAPGSVERLSVQALPKKPSNNDITQLLEYATFQQALSEVGQFRGWLLKSPLATIKSALSSPLASLPSADAATAMAEATTPKAVTVHS